jgi:hypothetical protein
MNLLITKEMRLSHAHPTTPLLCSHFDSNVRLVLQRQQHNNTIILTDDIDKLQTKTNCTNYEFY